MKKVALLVVLLLTAAVAAQCGGYASDFLPDTTGRNLGNSSQRWNAFMQNVDISGTLTYKGNQLIPINVSLWSACVAGYLKFDGSCSMPAFADLSDYTGLPAAFATQSALAPAAGTFTVFQSCVVNFKYIAGSSCYPTSQSALSAACNGADPGRATLPLGTSTSATGVTAPAYCAFDGSGAYKSTLKFSAVSPITDCFTSAYQGQLGGLQLLGDTSGTGTCSRVLKTYGVSNLRVSDSTLAGAAVFPGAGPLAGWWVENSSSDIWAERVNFENNGPLSGGAKGAELYLGGASAQTRFHLRNCNVVGRNTEGALYLFNAVDSDVFGCSIDQGNHLDSPTASGYGILSYAASTTTKGNNYSLNNIRNTAGSGIYFNGGSDPNVDHGFVITGNYLYDVTKQQSFISVPVGGITTNTVGGVAQVGNVVDTSQQPAFTHASETEGVSVGNVGHNSAAQGHYFSAVAAMAIAALSSYHNAGDYFFTGTNARLAMIGLVGDYSSTYSFGNVGALNDSVLSSSVLANGGAQGVLSLGGARNIFSNLIVRSNVLGADIRGSNNLITGNMVTGGSYSIDTTSGSGGQMVVANYTDAAPLTGPLDINWGNYVPGGSDFPLFTYAHGSSYGMDILGVADGSVAGGARNLLRVGQISFSNGFTVAFDGTKMLYTFNDGPVTVQGTNGQFNGPGTGLTGTASGLSIGGNAATATTSTNVAGGVVGSVPYQTAAATTAMLAGNTAATDQVLVSHGTGSAALAPTLSNAPALSAANMTSFPTRSVSIMLDSPVTGDSGHVIVVNPAVAIHLTRMFCSVYAATNVVVNLDKRAEATYATDSGHHLLGSDLTAVTGGANTATFANGSGQCGGTTSCAIAAHTPVVLTVTSVSGTPASLGCSVDYTVD